MNQEQKQVSRFRQLVSLPGRGNQWLAFLRRRLGVALRNGLRRLRRARIDYVVIQVGGTLPERAAPPRRFFQRFLPFPEPPLSMQGLNTRLLRIADAPNVEGVIFHLTGLTVGLGTLQNLRRAIERLRANGKEAIVYTPSLDLAHYYVASAADKIIAPPGSIFEVLGLRVEAVFLKDALERVGVHVDVFQISPYKTALNTLGESGLTDAQREQLSWILDDNFDQITYGMAAGRGMEQIQLKGLIDQAPFPVEEAADHGLVDYVAYEDELPDLLAQDHEQPESTQQESDKKRKKRPKILSWSAARRLLAEKAYHVPEQIIGVISLEGAIAPGPSRQPPIDLPLPLIGGAMAGERTLTKLLRRAERMNNLAALILHVDSPGGEAQAADLIWREVDRVAQKKPVLVYMGNVAASGGYYVSATAKYIMAQEGTLTGSIGVIVGRASTDRLLRKVSVNRELLTRGKHAAIYSDVGELSEEERELVWNNLVYTYQRFKEVVSRGREIPLSELDPICEGRVWTGRQAGTLGLVDGHGDFVDAIDQAVKLAGLEKADEPVPVANLYPSGSGYLLPRPYESPKAILEWFSDERWLAWSGRALALLPFDLRWR